MTNATVFGVLSDAQTKRQLSNLGLSEKQVSALRETLCQLKGSGFFREAPTITGVKRPLADVSRSLYSGARRLQGVLAQAQGGPDAAARDAGNAVYVAASEHGITSDELSALIQNVLALAGYCDSALAQLPIQRRSRHAHWMPVARIWETVNRAREPDQTSSPRLSASPTSAFREICMICYAFMTDNPNADPERGLKKFVALEKRRSEAKIQARNSVKGKKLRTSGRNIR